MGSAVERRTIAASTGLPPVSVTVPDTAPPVVSTGVSRWAGAHTNLRNTQPLPEEPEPLAGLVAPTSTSRWRR